MIVCSCNQLTDRQILESLTGDAGDRPRSPGQVYRCLGCKPDCGRCVRQIRQMFADITSELASNSCQIGCAVCPGDAGHTLADMVAATVPQHAQPPAFAALHQPAPASAPWQKASYTPRGRTFSVPESQRFNAGQCGQACNDSQHLHGAHAPAAFHGQTHARPEGPAARSLVVTQVSAAQPLNRRHVAENDSVDDASHHALIAAE